MPKPWAGATVSDTARYRSRKPPITSKLSSAKPGGSILLWQLAQLASARCFSSCSRIVTAPRISGSTALTRSEEHTSELQSLTNLVCRLLLEKKQNHKLRLRQHNTT